MRAHFVIPAALVVLPWAACARQPPANDAGATASQTGWAVTEPTTPSTSTAEASTATATAVDADPTSAPQVPTVAAPEADPVPPVRSPKDRRACAALNAKVDAFLDAHRTCKTPADCVEVRSACGTKGVCGAYLARSDEATFLPLADEVRSAECFAKGAVPCPSCRPLGPPACVAGKCEPTH